MVRRTGWGVLALAMLGCGPGRGALSVTTWGEAYIERGIPAAGPTAPGFVDGWAVTFERFVVVLGGFSLARATGERGPQQDAAAVVDLVRPGPVEVLSWADVPAMKWDRVGYGIGPAGASARAVGAVSAPDVERMRMNGLSLDVQGVGRRGVETRRFAWRFSTDTRYEDCTNPDFGAGVTVPAGGQEVVQLTVHGDHFFYDDLEAPTARLRFQAIADADADADGEVTLAELAAVKLTQLPLGQYGTGSAGRVRTLADFVTALGRTVGHFRGEGECLSQAR